MIRKLMMPICFLISFTCSGQLYDKVNIYAIHIGTSFAIENIDADYIRVNHKFKFSSTDRYYIDSLFNYFFKNIDSLQPYSYKDISHSIRVVIDFIHRERITSHIMINASSVFYLYETQTLKSGWFQLSSKEMCDINKVIPFFNMINDGACD